MGEPMPLHLGKDLTYLRFHGAGRAQHLVDRADPGRHAGHVVGEPVQLTALIAFWRTAEDARAFAARPEHRAAMRDLYQQRWQHSHFAAIWEMTSSHDRVIFCPDCQAVTPAARQRCGGCGTELFDVYRA